MISQASKIANNILIIDDDPDILKFLVGLFDDQIGVSFAPSGAKALEHVQANKPDLILLDVEMPEMDGFAVCRQLKSDPATQHIPVIFLTAMADEKDITEGLRLGAVDYITKPIDAKIVIAKVKNQLAHLKQLPVAEAGRSGAARDRRDEGAARDDRRSEGAARADRGGAAPQAAAPRGARGAAPQANASRGRRGEGGASKGIPPRTIIMAVVALLVIGGGFMGMKLYNERTAVVTVDGNWPFSSKCAQSPFASWWGTSTHASMVEYVNNRHSGDWNPYIDKWANQLNKLIDIDSRNGRVSTSDGTVLRGDALKQHIDKLEARIVVIRCLANEARYVK